MAEFPVLPIFTDAILGDTQHLSAAEFGAYMLTLIVAWRDPDCSLPNDPAYLGRITRSPKSWTRVGPVVMAFWTLGEDGRYRQRRLTQERLRAANLAHNARTAGKASALKRQETRSTSVQRGVNGKATPFTLALTPTPLSNDSGGATGQLFAKPEAKKATRLPDDWELPDEWRMVVIAKRDKMELPPIHVELEAEKFANFWRSKAGKDGAKLDWRATWINWCLGAAAKAGSVPTKGMAGSFQNKQRELSVAEKATLVAKWGMQRAGWSELYGRICKEGLADRWHRVQ